MYKIIFNPYNLQIAINYRNVTHITFFKENCEWLTVGYDEKIKKYLHIQLDYDECLQLIVYHRTIDVEDYLADSSWLSDGSSKSRKIKIVSSDKQFQKELSKL